MSMTRQEEKSYKSLWKQRDEARAEAESFKGQLSSIQSRHDQNLKDETKKLKQEKEMAVNLLDKILKEMEIQLGQKEQTCKILRASCTNLTEDKEKLELFLSETKKALDDEKRKSASYINMIAELQKEKTMENVRDLRRRLHNKTTKVSELEQELEKAHKNSEREFRNKELSLGEWVGEAKKKEKLQELAKAI